MSPDTSNTNSGTEYTDEEDENYVRLNTSLPKLTYFKEIKQDLHVEKTIKNFKSLKKNLNEFEYNDENVNHSNSFIVKNKKINNNSSTFETFDYADENFGNLNISLSKKCPNQKKQDSENIEILNCETKCHDASISDYEDLKDPFGFGDKNPFDNREDKYEKKIVSNFYSAFNEDNIPITQAKQRILACCRDLQISQEREILYHDVQKIYFRHFGVNLNQNELCNIFGEPKASMVLTHDLGRYLKITSTKQDKVIKLKARTDINEALYQLENDEIFGILEPIPKLSYDEVTSILGQKLGHNEKQNSKTLYFSNKKQDIAKLRSLGFAKENFDDLPQIKNPTFNKSEDEITDIFTEDENEFESPLRINIKQLMKDSFFNDNQKLKNVQAYETFSLKKRKQLSKSRCSSDSWTDDNEDHIPKLLYSESYKNKFYQKSYSSKRLERKQFPLHNKDKKESANTKINETFSENAKTCKPRYFTKEKTTSHCDKRKKILKVDKIFSLYRKLVFTRENTDNESNSS